MGDASTLQLLDAPEAHAAHPGEGGLPLWLLLLVLPPLLGSAPGHQKLAGKHVAGKQRNGFVALFVLCRYQGTITWHCVPAWLVMRPWGTGRVSPQGERGSVVGGLWSSTHPMLAVLAGCLPGAGPQEGSPRAAEVVVRAFSPKPAPGAC